MAASSVVMPLRFRVMRAHHQHGADRTGEQRDSDGGVADMTGDRADQSDNQKIAHPGTRRTVGARFPRAAHEESDHEREQESHGGRVGANQLGHRERDVIGMLRPMLHRR